MTLFKKDIFYFSFIILLCFGCKEEAVLSSADSNKAHGDWILANAIRQGKLTKLLEGTTISIDSSSLETNLFGKKDTYQYVRKGDEIQLIGNDNQLLKIDKSTNDTLILAMKRKNKKYQLLMVRAEQVEEYLSQ